MLDQAFETLKTYNWGDDRKALNPIDEAIVATQGDAAARRELEDRLAAVLKTDVSYDAKQFVCRKLMVMGAAASVPTLAALLPQEDLSHMARYALERIGAPEAAQALRDALPKLSGELKIGVIGSLGVRQDAAAVAPLTALLGDDDAAIARSAAIALGAIRSADAAQALQGAESVNAEARLAVVDSLLMCAEQLLADGNKGDAKLIYMGLMRGDHPKHVKLAATRGMLACAGQ